MRVLVLVLAVALAGCAEEPAPEPAAGEPVPFRTILHAMNDAIATAGEGVIDEASWNETWSRHAAGIDPPPAKPFVAFDRETLVMVSLGQRPSGCHDAQVHDARRDAGGLVVRWREFDGSDRPCTDNLVWPTHVVAVEGRFATARFVRDALVGADGAWERVEPALAPIEPLAPRALANGSFSGIHEDTRALVRDAASWEALWREHRASEPVPEVDFAREMVVAIVVHGPTGCAGIHLRALAHHPEPRVVTVELVRERSPPEIQCFVAFEDVFEFVAIPALDATLYVVDTEEP